MKAVNKIILGFILSFYVFGAEAQDTKSMFANTQPTKRIYNDKEILLPNNLQYAKAGASENVLESAIVNNLLQISWQTIKETNTSHFELQRSKDGVNFEPIETIAASGLSQESRSYSSAQAPENISNHPLYFRVKCVFVNGKQVYTTNLMVNMELAAKQNITN